MPRLCILFAVGTAFLVSVVAGPSGGESTLLWWHKALYAAAGGALAIAAFRLLPSPAHAPADGAARDRGEPCG